MADTDTDFALVFKRDGIEMFRYYPDRVTGQVAREFRAKHGTTTRALFDEFAAPETRDVDTWAKIVWLADRTGAHTLTPEAVEAMLGTQGNIQKHWDFEVDQPTVESEITAATDPET